MWRHKDGRTSETRPPEIEAIVERSVAMHLVGLRPHARHAFATGVDVGAYARDSIASLVESCRDDDKVLERLALESGLRALQLVMTEVWGVTVELHVPVGGP